MRERERDKLGVLVMKAFAIQETKFTKWVQPSLKRVLYGAVQKLDKTITAISNSNN